MHSHFIFKTEDQYPNLKIDKSESKKSIGIIKYNLRRQKFLSAMVLRSGGIEEENAAIKTNQNDSPIEDATSNETLLIILTLLKIYL